MPYEYVKRFILNGVKLLGGCCGTTLSHIKAMRAAIKALQPPERHAVTVSSPAEEKAEKTRTPMNMFPRKAR